MAGGAFTNAQASVEYGGHYYEFAKTYGTWDEVNTMANTSTKTFESVTYAGHLWTLNSQSEYTSVASNLGFSSWEIAWVGARNVNGTYTWVNNEGAVDFTGWISGIWSNPNTADYGASIGGAGYGYDLGTQSSSATCQYVIEYESVPEPTSLVLVAFGTIAMALKRRKTER